MRWTTYPTIPAATDALRPRRRSRWHCDGKSVLLTREFEPAWFDVAPVEGRFQDFAVRGQGLGAHVRGRIWSPDDSCDPMALLVAHDGPEYDEFAQLTRYSGAMIAAGTLPPHRVALLAPGARDEWYSASALYSRALYLDVVPGLRQAVAIDSAPVGMGARTAHGCRSTFSSHLPSRCPLKYALAVRRMRPHPRPRSFRNIHKPPTWIREDLVCV